MIRPNFLCVPLVLALALTACSGADESANEGASSATTSVDTGTGTGAALRADVVAHYADGVFASYEAAVASAQSMADAIDAFVATPSEATLTVAKDGWLAARPDYGVTEAFRFYGGPIDDEETGPEGQLNAWPMDESYVDYVDGNESAGIVNDPDTYPTIDAALLTSLNEVGGETNISTGWHAIEFLLWGQDLADDGPGARPARDFVDAPNAMRRGQYLTAATELLLADLAGLAAAWDPAGTDNYRTEFVALPVDEALTAIITGVGEMSRGELAGERMSVAYTERSQEDEHSCFSDNTTNDIIANAQGVANVISGDYPGGVSGPGLEALIASVDDALAAQLDAAVAASVVAAEAIPAPFDQHLRDGISDDDPGRVAILDTIDGLGTQTDLIVAGADLLGLAIEVS